MGIIITHFNLIFPTEDSKKWDKIEDLWIDKFSHKQLRATL